MDVMAGVSWEGSMAVNLGRSELSRRGLDVVVGSATVDMVRAVVVVVEQEEDVEEEVMVVRAR